MVVHQRDNGFPTFGPSPDLFSDLALTFRLNTGVLPVGPVNCVAPTDFALVCAPTNVLLHVGVGNAVPFSIYVQFFADGVFLGHDNCRPQECFARRHGPRCGTAHGSAITARKKLERFVGGGKVKKAPLTPASGRFGNVTHWMRFDEDRRRSGISPAR